MVGTACRKASAASFSLRLFKNGSEAMTSAAARSLVKVAKAGSNSPSVLDQGAVLGVGAQYAVSPWVSVGLDYLYGIYGPQEHGGAVGYTALSNFFGVFSSSGNLVVQSPQNLTTHTARFVINLKLD